MGVNESLSSSQASALRGESRHYAVGLPEFGYPAPDSPARAYVVPWTELLRQDPLPGIEGHVSYSFAKAWASIDSLYDFRGTTYVNGVNQSDAQQNFTLGGEINVSLNSRNSLVLQFAKALVHQNAPTYSGFAVKYAYTWGKGYH